MKKLKVIFYNILTQQSFKVVVFSVAISIVFWFQWIDPHVFHTQKVVGSGDSRIFYLAAKTVTEPAKYSIKTQDLYDQVALESSVDSVVKIKGGTKFLYPPTAILFFLPFSFLPFIYMVKIWAFINIIAWTISYVIIIRYWFNQSPFNLRFSVLFIALSFSSVIEQLFYSGQINAIILFLIITALSFANQHGRSVRYQWIAGLLLGSAVLIKVFPVIFFGLLIVYRRWVALLSAVVTILSSVVLSCALFGVRFWSDFYHNIWQRLSIADLGFARDSISLYGSFRMSFCSGVLKEFAISAEEKSELIRTVVNGFADALPFILLFVGLIIFLSIYPMKKSSDIKLVKQLLFQNKPMQMITDRLTIDFSLLATSLFLFSAQASRSYSIYLIVLWVYLISAYRKIYIQALLFFSLSVLWFYDLILPEKNAMFFGTVKYTTIALMTLFLVLIFLEYQYRTKKIYRSIDSNVD